MPFGQDYQREVQDVNAGRTEQQGTAAVLSSRDTSSSKHTKLDTRTNTQSVEKLLGFAVANLSGIKKRADIKAYDEAYANGSQEALDKLAGEEKGITTTLFGHSAKYKGFQDRVVENEVESNYQRALGTIEQDSRNFKTLGDFKANQDAQLRTALEKQTDPETKNKIIKAFTKNAKTLAGQYTRNRKLYEQILNRKEATRKLTSANETIEAAKLTKDPSVVEDANKRMQDTLKRPNDIDPVAWEGIVSQAITSDLTNGNENLLQVATASGALKDFSPEIMDDIKNAKAIWNQEYSQRFYTKGTELEQALLSQDKSFKSDLAVYKKQYPSVDMNKWKKAWNKQADKVALEKRTLQSNTLKLSQGMGKSISNKADRTKAYDNLIDQISTKSAMKIRKQDIRDNPQMGLDLNQAMTQAEKDEAIKTSPNTIISHWQANQSVQTPILQRSISNVLTLSNADELTVEQGEVLKKDIKFLQSFRQRDQARFAKEFANNKPALARLIQMDLLMNGLNQTHREAILNIRSGKKKPVLTQEELTFEDRDDMALDALRDFTDSNGFENVLGWSSDPDNQDALQWEAKEAFETALTITNDPEAAQAMTMDFLAADSLKFGDNLLMKGAQLDKNSKNGDFAAYSDLVDNIDGWKDRWEAAGFPRNRSIKDSTNEIMMHQDGRGITIKSSNVDGNPIFIDLLAPTADADMRLAVEGQSENKTGIVEDFFNLATSSFQKTGEILDDVFNTPDLPDSHLPPEAPEEPAAPSLNTGTIERTAAPVVQPEAPKAAPSPVIADILKKEGGLSLNKNDKGNFNSKGELVGTNFGISAKFLENKLGRPPTKDDMKNLTKEKAAEFHQENINTEIAAIKKSTKKEVAPKSELLLSHMVTLTSRRGILKVFKNLPSNAPPEQVAEEYIKYLKTLSAWKSFGKGWTNRINAILKQS